MSYNTPIKTHYSVEAQRDRLPLYLREFYEIRQLDRIKIDGTEIQGYFEYSFFKEKTYVKSPERSSGGTIDNLNSYSTFLTPRLVIKYNYMHISDYRKLMNILYSKNEFVVECYDIVKDQRVTHKMYFAPTEMPSIHQRNLEVLGIKNYTIELIGTNVGFDTVEIRYHDMEGNLIPEATKTVDKGTDEIIYYDYVAPQGYRFEGKWLDKSGAVFHNNDVIYMYSDFDLYAETKVDGQYTLSFSYGNGNVLYSQTSGAITSVPIIYGEKINSAIDTANITLDNGEKFTFATNGTGGLSVKHENEYIVPYDFKGWYWTPEANEGTKVNGLTAYNYSINRTIYQVYEPKKYNLTFNTNTNGEIIFDTVKVAYNSAIMLPALRMNGFTFIGWFTDSTLTKSFSGKMPPKDLTLYAKWEKNK